MATEAQLIAALRQADATGDHQGATRIAQIIQAQRATPAHDNLLGQFARGAVGGARDLANSVGDALNVPQQVRDLVNQGRNVFSGKRPGAPTTTDYVGKVAPPVSKWVNQQPVSEGGRMARSVGSMVPNAFGGEASLALRGARVLLPGVAAEGARAATEAAGGGRLAQGVAQVVGGGLGGVAPELASNTGNAMKGAALETNRDPVSGHTAQLAQLAMEKHGIPLRSDQIAASGGDRAAGIRDSNLIGSNKDFQASNLAQRQAFTNAVGKTFGASGPLTTDTMAAARAKLSQGFEDHAASTGVAYDPQLHADLDRIQANAREIGLSDNEIGAVDKQVAKIHDIGQKSAAVPDATPAVANDASDPEAKFGLQSGSAVIPGAAYQGLTQSGSALDSIISGRGALATQGQAIRVALQNAAARAGGPEAQAKLADLRSQWANLKTVEPLAEKAGQNGGLISPVALQGRVNATFNNAAYGSGGDLKELGDIGQAFLKEPPNSLTPDRLLDKVKAPAAYAAMGADLLAGIHNPMDAIPGAVALAGGYAASKGLNALKAARSNSPAATNALLGRGAPPVSITDLNPRNAFLPALIAGAAPVEAQDRP